MQGRDQTHTCCMPQMDLRAYAGSPAKRAHHTEVSPESANPLAHPSKAKSPALGCFRFEPNAVVDDR
jgi:hypothetical protein